MSGVGTYAGRFAPTPSGPLHVGSLIAAVASRCDALACGGRWMLRIDDIDPPRERPGARAAIPRTLVRYGLSWDGPVRYQSERLAHYAERLAALAVPAAGGAGRLYRCDCPRSALRDLPRYPGTCRHRHVVDAAQTRLGSRPLPVPGDALRLRLDGRVRIEDVVQGTLEVELVTTCGDVVVRRRDGLVAYPLACAVDDADVIRVVRGADLLDATAAQIAVLGCLDAPAPAWAHVPVAVDGRGRKLGKSTGATPIDALVPLPTLRAVWAFLGQTPLPTANTIEAFWREAPRAWSLARVPRARARPAPEGTA